MNRLRPVLWSIVVASAAACGGVGGGSPPAPAATLTLARAGAGTIGPGGVSLSATLAQAGGAAPATVQVRAGDVVVATLARANGAGDPLYAGAWLPAAGLDGEATLVARATAGGAVVESAPLALAVDTTPPQVTGLAVTCSVAHADGACRRHESLGVVVSAGDAAEVAATLDLDGHAMPVALHRDGAGWAGAVALPRFRFPRLEGDVVLRIRAVDALGNVSNASQKATRVTRLRWEYDTGGAGVTESAIDLAQRVAFGVRGAAAGALRILQPGCDPAATPGACVTEVELGLGVELAAAPMLGFGFHRIWFPTTAGQLLARGWDGSAANGAGCSVVAAGPAAMSPRNADVVVVNGDAMYTADGTNCNVTPFPPTHFLGPSTSTPGGSIYALEAESGHSLRAFRFFESTLALVPSWVSPFPIGPPSTAPLAIDRQNRILVLSGDGTLFRVTDAGSSGQVAALAVLVADPTPAAAVSPVVLRDDSIVVALGARLVRLSDAGAILWSRTLADAVTGVVATVPDASGVAMYVTTAGGALHALRLDGAEAWDAPAQVAAAALGSPNIGVSESAELLYVGAADGKLRAIVVDAELDLTAPWPKPYRDEQNSSRAH